MAFVRLSDDYDEHPKIVGLSDGAFRLWHQILAYSRRYETDGCVPMAIVKSRTSFTITRLRELTTPYRPDANALCVEADGAVTIHDYLEWNHSKNERDQQKAAARARVQKHRSNAVGNGVSNGVSNGVGNALRNAHVLGMGIGNKKEEGVAATVSPMPRRLGRGVLAGSLPADHLRHAVCGRVCLPDFKFRQFANKCGGDASTADERVRVWAQGVLEQWDSPPLASQPIQGRDLEFWDVRFSEWVGAAPRPANAAQSPGRVVPGVEASRKLLEEMKSWS